MRGWSAGLLWLILLLGRPAWATEAGDGLYARVEQHLTAVPALAASLGRPAPEMADIAWMTGEWQVDAMVCGNGHTDHGISHISPVFGGVWLEMRDSYPDGNQDLGYLGFSATAGGWISLGLDKAGNANLTPGRRLPDGSIVIEGDFLIVGIKAHLRQTLHRLDADSFRIDNEELMAQEWKPVDTYLYRRRRTNGAGAGHKLGLPVSDATATREILGAAVRNP